VTYFDSQGRKLHTGMFLRFPVWIVIASLLSQSYALDPSQTAALIDLYTATNGDSWSVNTNWLNGDPCNFSWYGVTCDSTFSNVTILSLDRNGLNGTIPSSLSALLKINQL
jgi:hypothetical protein